MSRPKGKFLLFGIVFLLIAGACAAPTPVSPTLAPPTLAPTPVSPTPVPPTPVPPTPVPPTLVPTLVPPTPVPPTLAPTPDLIAPLLAMQEAFNQRNTEAFLALFVEQPTWTLLLGTITSLQVSTSALAIRNTVEWQYELNTQLEVTECSPKNGKVTCVLLFTDDCKPPAIDAYHFRTQITFEDNKISTVKGRWDTADETAFMSYDSLRLAWARENLPQDALVYNMYPADYTQEASKGRNEWGKFELTGDQGTGQLTATEFGQLVDRICMGYTEAGN